MHRREFCRRGAVAAVGGVGVISGCLGGRPDVVVRKVNSRRTAEGRIAVLVTLENRVEERRQVRITATVDISGGDTFRNTRETAVPGGASRRYRVVVDAGISAALGTTDYEADAEVEIVE